MTRSAAGPFPGQPAADGIKPWDARLAALLVRPLVRTRVHPNHLTTLSLITGLAAALYGTADRQAANWGGALYVVTNLLDHADGELARMAGKTSVAGGFFDRLTVPRQEPQPRPAMSEYGRLCHGDGGHAGGTATGAG
jgi:2-methylaconitate cis-trans-isomerase PrpF